MFIVKMMNFTSSYSVGSDLKESDFSIKIPEDLKNNSKSVTRSSSMIHLLMPLGLISNAWTFSVLEVSKYYFEVMAFCAI